MLIIYVVECEWNKSWCFPLKLLTLYDAYGGKHSKEREEKKRVIRTRRTRNYPSYSSLQSKILPATHGDTTKEILAPIFAKLPS